MTELIACYCGEQVKCDCSPQLPIPKIYSDKEKATFFHRMMIDLHTFRWTGDGVKVGKVLDAIGVYTHSHTNGNVCDDDFVSERAFERLVNKINEIVLEPASWKNKTITAGN